MLGLCSICAPKISRSQSLEGDPFRFLIWLKTDTQSIGAGLLSTSPAKLAVGISSTFIVSRFDEKLAKESESWRNRELMRVLEELGDANAVRPFAFVIFAGSLFTDNHKFQDAAFASVEALIYANVLTNALKFGFGRQRPWQGEDAFVFRPFSGNTSFPSGHATTAFAAITPWILYYPNTATVLAITLATGTAFSRIPLKYHWPSDVMAGALIGFSTASWLVRRHQQGDTSSNLTFHVAPQSFSLRLKLN